MKVILGVDDDHARGRPVLFPLADPKAWPKLLDEIERDFAEHLKR